MNRWARRQGARGGSRRLGRDRHAAWPLGDVRGS